MRRPPLNHNNSGVRRERDASALTRLALLLLCGLMLAGGFVFGARQHFAAVQYGYKNEDLRRERLRLLEEQQRLLLEKEEACSPARLEPAARVIGLQPLQPAQIVTRKENPGSGSSSALALIKSSASLRH